MNSASQPLSSIAQQQAMLTKRVFNSRGMSRAEFQIAIDELEEMIKGVPGVTLRDDERTPLEHYFAPGLYAREIFIPAGYLLTTGIHATEHIAIVSQGSCVVATENGVEHISAPHTRITKIGTKRAMFVKEDLVWTTVHAIDAKTPEEAIEMIEFKNWEDVPCLCG